MPNLGMNAIPCHSLALASLLLCQPFLGWQIFCWLTRCDPEKSCWPEKNNIIFSLIFKLNNLSQLNTNSVWSNMVLTSGAKIQMSSRYSSKVIHCWSPRHGSINLQKLDLTFDRPKGIWVNVYRAEEPALNVVFLMSSSAIANCKYSCTRSKEVKTLLLLSTP